MLKICPGKFYNFIERFENLLKTYINYDNTPLPLFVDKAVQILSTHSINHVNQITVFKRVVSSGNICV